MAELKLRADIPDEFKWKITDIYENDELWEKEYNTLKERLKEFDSFHGKAGESAEYFIRISRKTIEYCRKLPETGNFDSAV